MEIYMNSIHTQLQRARAEIAENIPKVAYYGHDWADEIAMDRLCEIASGSISFDGELMRDSFVETVNEEFKIIQL